MTGLAPEFDLLRTDWPLLAATDAPVVRTLNVTAPFDRSVIAQVAVAGERHVQDALFAAFALFRQKDRRLSRARRKAVLDAASQMIADNAEVFAREAARESGKPLQGCNAEVRRVLEVARTASTLLDAKSFQPSGGASEVQQLAEPLGVAVAIIGTNSPLEVAARQLFAAVAAGVPILIKPAQHTPLSCLRLVQLLHESGLPYVWAQGLVLETHELVQQLVTDPRVALLSYTGSAAVGWSLRSQLPPGTRCVLDHGSVAPAIVADDADWDLAVDSIIAAGFLSTAGGGESLQRVFIAAANAEDFALKLSQQCQSLQVGDPLELATEVGALARPDDVERLLQWVSDAVDQGARVLAGGMALGTTCFLPTVVLDPPLDALLFTQPAGGSLIAVYGVGDLAAACDRANALPFARSALVFTRSESIAANLCHALDASHIVTNGELDAGLDDYQPNGLRRSGLGASGVAALATAMQMRKTIVHSQPLQKDMHTDQQIDAQTDAAS